MLVREECSFLGYSSIAWEKKHGIRGSVIIPFIHTKGSVVISRLRLLVLEQCLGVKFWLR